MALSSRMIKSCFTSLPWPAESTHVDEQDSGWDPGRYRHRRAALHPVAGTPSLVRGRVAGGVRALRRAALREGRELAAEDADPGTSGADDRVAGGSHELAEDRLRGPRLEGRAGIGAKVRRGGLRRHLELERFPHAGGRATRH